MAPLVRGRAGSRRGSHFASRETRTSVSSRSRGNPAAKNGSRSIFHSTRVQEQLDDDVDASEGSQVFTEDGLSSSIASDTSDDEGLEHRSSTVDPYNTLLQSLNTKAKSAPPRKKRRKIGLEVPKETQSIEEIRQSPLEQSDLITADVEDPQDLLDGQDAASIEDIEESSVEDPFSKTYADPDEARLAVQIKNVKSAMQNTAKVILPSGTSCPMTAPGESETSKKIFDAPPKSTQEIQLKRKLQGPAAKILPVWNDIHRDLGCLMFNYVDLLYVERTTRNADTLRKMSCVHLLNHVFKTRDKVIKHNARLMKETNDVDLELRDQGFTRPKVLIILPTRQSCVKWVETVASLCEPEQQENRKRFQDSFTQTEDPLSEEKPDDFRELFGGNDDDMFRLGLKFTRKTIKYFSAFYNSDVIFASPLGLRLAIGAENDKKQDYDFLSSIEIMIADQADALSMQNWEHIDFIFEHLNLQPKEAHGCDFSRVRNWYLDGDAKYLRQTMLFSAFNFPALNRLYLHQMQNIAGKVRIAKHHEGAILQLGHSIKQTFSRFEYQNPVSEPDDRFAYFKSAIVPILIRSTSESVEGKQGILVYLPSYADFVRVRNHLATSSTTQNISFGSISEYTSIREVARARSHFFTGRHSVLLYTERAHHFRRYKLRGVRKIFMYGLPENPIFYEEIVGGYLGASVNEGKISTGKASVRGLFSKLDILKFERIVGSSRISSMLRDKGGDTFDFI